MKKTNLGVNSKGFKNVIPLLIILIFLIGIPLIIILFQSNRTGTSPDKLVIRLLSKSSSQEIDTINIQGRPKGGKIDFLTSRHVGQEFTDPPQISNLQAEDLDKDGLLDIIVCDTKNNFISWIRQSKFGIFEEIVLATGIIAPAHIQIIDFDFDGDKDIMAAVLGMLFPNNDKIGSVVILENEGQCTFVKHVVANKIARVSDVRAGDLDNDSDMDLAVTQFGYDDGETRWIENLGGWKFKSHIIQTQSGPINAEITDIDNDNDLDIITIVSQEWEEIYCFINDGKGKFSSRMIYGSSNEDFGSSGIDLCDLDQDGDEDILYSNGDAFDYIPPMPRPWHGLQWLENLGNLNFSYHRLCNFPGAYNLRAVDIDKDNDLDLFAVSGFNTWDNPESQSFIWLENSGSMEFIKHDLASKPTHLLTLEPGDFNNDGQIDFVTGGMHAYPPYDRMGRVTLWMNNGLFTREIIRK